MRHIMLHAALLLSVGAAPGQEESVMQITATVDFGEDRGQNFGTLFEARDADGHVLCGAGFAGLYNTAFRMDRYTLQFFVRADGGAETFETLPAPSEDGGNYLFDLDGRVYQFSWYRDQTARWWDEESGTWQVDESFGRHATRSGEGKMRVAGKVLQFRGGEAWYAGAKVLGKPTTGHYHHFYYALGHLVFFHNNRSGAPAFSRLYAVPWRPDQSVIDLSNAVTLDVKYPGETPFAIGQLGDEIINSSNLGGVYAFDGSRWNVLRTAQKGVSYQLYSMLNWYDKLLMAQYPTGNLFEYDGKQIRQLKDWPPMMPGVSNRARESQTTCIYGGDLYVGVWPWAELWRYDAQQSTWQFVRRMFERPAITDQMVHPWDDRIAEYNRTHETQVVGNGWGQRVTGLNPMGDALYISVSAKGCFQRDMRLEFLHDDKVWDAYRVVHRMRKPGCAAAAIRWTGSPTTLQFSVTADRLSIAQDGRELVSAPVVSSMTAALKDARLEWGTGMFGPLRGALRTTSVHPLLPADEPNHGRGRPTPGR